MFERFTDDARRTVVLAQEEARILDHDHIGTEHLLLGVIHEERGTGARALAAFDVPLERVRERVEQIVGRGKGAPPAHVPFTPRAKKVLELSLRESLRLGHEGISSGHVLLALLREGGGVGMLTLTQLGVDSEDLRAALLRTLDEAGEIVPRAPRRARWFRRGGPGHGVGPGHSAGPVHADVQAPGEPRGESEQPGVLEQFDDVAWQALAGARACARARHAAALGCTDLLAGIVGAGGTAAQLLRDAGADPDALAAAAAAAAGTDRDPPEALWFDPALRAVLLVATEDAISRGAGAVTAVHLLHGLLLAGDDAVDDLLAAQGVDGEALRSAVRRHLDAAA